MVAPRRRLLRGIPLRSVPANFMTIVALCSGLTAVRFAIDHDWAFAVGAIVLAGVFDGLDGRIARMLNGESRFGAELDSLSDVIAFGVAPALVIFLWSLHDLPRFGWIFALGYAVCAALRLARFNAAIDATEQPHKSAGFLTGVPAPAAAGLALLPLYLWLVTGLPVFAQPILTGAWLALVSLLMISSVATYSWGSLRLRRSIRFPALAASAIVFGALLAEPVIGLIAVCATYLALIPFSIRSYRKVRQQRAAAALRGMPTT